MLLRVVAQLFLIFFSFPHSTEAGAQTSAEFLPSKYFHPPPPKTNLYSIEHGSELSEIMSRHSKEGFELQNGRWISFSGWYKTQWKDLRVTFITSLNKNFDVIWGLGTGESGRKYKIQPSAQLGLAYNIRNEKLGIFSIQIKGRLGGRLIEKPCEADYGLVSPEVQLVNCRLAATELEPSETLRYLYNLDPPDRKPEIKVVYMRFF